jgi:hypothetical protein
MPVNSDAAMSLDALSTPFKAHILCAISGAAFNRQQQQGLMQAITVGTPTPRDHAPARKRHRLRLLQAVAMEAVGPQVVSLVHF